MAESVESGVELPTIGRETLHGTNLAFARGRRLAAFELDETRIQRGSVYIEDAVYDRLTYHRFDQQFLKVYRFHGSWPCQIFISFIIFIFHMLIFFEDPSSLSWTADLKSSYYTPVSGLIPSMVALEGVCLVVLAIDCCIQIYGYGLENITSYRWLMLYALSLAIAFIGWVVSIAFLAVSCGVICKFRCFFRPPIMLQHSDLMRKALMCLIKSIPSICSVFLLFFIHILLFTLIGLIIMPYDKGPAQLGPPGEYHIHFGGGVDDALMNMFILLTTANSPDIMTRAYNDNRLWAIFFIIYVAIGIHFLLHILFAVIFQQFRQHFRDSMRHTVLRRKAALVAAFEGLSDINDQSVRFIPIDRLHKVISTLSLNRKLKEELIGRVNSALSQNMNFTWNVFQETFGSIIFSRKRKRDQLEVDAFSNKFDPLREHSRAAKSAKADIEALDSGQNNSTFVKRWSPYLRLIFSHQAFIHLGSILTFINVFFILSQVNETAHLRIIEKETGLFLILYLFEQIAIAWALTPRRYISITLHRLDFISFLLSALSALAFTIIFHSSHNLSDQEKDTAMIILAGATHIFVGIRLLRVILSMKLPNLILKTTTDLFVNLIPFIGLLASLYYVFAVLGMMLFAGKIKYSPEMEGCWRWEGNDSSIANSTLAGTECPYGGGYHQRDYWSENFNDFASSLVVLWNLMLVNNWDILVKAFSNATSAWASLYFIAWYVMSFALTMSLLTAVIVENFLMRWSIFAKHERSMELQKMAKKVAELQLAAQLAAAEVEDVDNQSRNNEAPWQRAKRLRKQRRDLNLQHISVNSGVGSGANSMVRPTQSAPLSLFQILDVKMPSMEEVRQHLELSPYAPTDFAHNVVTFTATYCTQNEPAATDTITDHTSDDEIENDA